MAAKYGLVLIEYMDCYLNSINVFNKNTQLLCSLLYTVVLYQKINREPLKLPLLKSSNLFNPPKTASLCSRVIGYFASQYIINMRCSIKHHIM